MKPILDVACGSRMFHYDKNNPRVLFVDNRHYYEELPTGHVVDVNPDTLQDFTSLPFKAETFYHVIFDPPHLLKAGKSSWLAKKYGVLNADTWQEDIKQGFSECFRVLKPNGTLVFKWNSDQIPHAEVLKLCEHKPIYGDRRSKTRWTMFVKE